MAYYTNGNRRVNRGQEEFLTPEDDPAYSAQPPTPNSGDLLVEKGQELQKSLEAAYVELGKATAKKDATKKPPSKFVRGASRTVKLLLDPCSKAADVLDIAGEFAPGCSGASKILKQIVQFEKDRRDNNERILAMFPKIATTLSLVAGIKPQGEDADPELLNDFRSIMDRITESMQKFGEFSEGYYKYSFVVARLWLSSQWKDKIQEFQEQFTEHATQLRGAIAVSTNVTVRKNQATLQTLSEQVDRLVGGLIGSTRPDEAEAEQFIDQSGGRDAVEDDTELQKEFAAQFKQAWNTNVEQIFKENVDQLVSQCTPAFNLKLELVQSYMIMTSVTKSRDDIIKELNSGPYELISDPLIKETWKDLSEKASSIKRRLLIDGLVDHLSRDFKTYETEHEKPMPDAWTIDVLEPMAYQSAVGDAIDQDSSGYISVTEMNELLARKPQDWTTAQWLAYWAYGWDADNIQYGNDIMRSLKIIKGLADKGSVQQKEAAQSYVKDLEKNLTLVSNSVYSLDDLSDATAPKMTELRKKFSDEVRADITKAFKVFGAKVDTSDAAFLLKSPDRLENRFMAVLSALISYHVYYLRKGLMHDGRLQDAKDSVILLIQMFEARINTLMDIWRRQRITVTDQITFYANGLFEDYYKANMANDQSQDDDSDNDDDADSTYKWSDDEKDDQQGQQQAPATTVSSAATAAPRTNLRSVPGQQGQQNDYAQQRRVAPQDDNEPNENNPDETIQQQGDDYGPRSQQTPGGYDGQQDEDEQDGQNYGGQRGGAAQDEDGQDEQGYGRQRGDGGQDEQDGSYGYGNSGNYRDGNGDGDGNDDDGNGDGDRNGDDGYS